MKEKLCPWLALGLSGLCLLFWEWIWSSIYDPETQLVSDGSLTGLFFVFILVCGLILLLLSRSRVQRAQGPGRFGVLGIGLRLLAALLSVAAGIQMLRALLPTVSPIPLALAILLLLNGAAWIACTSAKKTKAGWQTTLLLLPPFVSCYWLVAFYHEYGSCPSWLTYLWPILGGLLVAWAWLAYVSRIYQPRKYDFALALALLAVLLLGPSLAAPISDGYRLSLAAQMAWFFAVALEADPSPEPIRKEHSNV